MADPPMKESTWELRDRSLRQMSTAFAGGNPYSLDHHSITELNNTLKSLVLAVLYVGDTIAERNSE